MESEAVIFWIVVWIVASLAGGLTALGVEKFRRWRTTRRILKAIHEQIEAEDMIIGTTDRDKHGRITSRPRN
jgi:hypothetical protein